MKDFDYIIIGGGCAGLSLAHELNLYKKFENRTLAIIEPREEYKRDKTWSFWKVIDHNFEDCVKKSWDNFTINSKYETQHLQCNDFPYQSIDSGLFYSKIINELKKNKNISFFKDIKEINVNNSFIFNSVPTINKNMENLWQHFCGVEIQTKNDIYDKKNTLKERFHHIIVRLFFIFATLKSGKHCKTTISKPNLSKHPNILNNKYLKTI